MQDDECLATINWLIGGHTKLVYSIRNGTKKYGKATEAKRTHTLNDQPSL